MIVTPPPMCPQRGRRPIRRRQRHALPIARASPSKSPHHPCLSSPRSPLPAPSNACPRRHGKNPLRNRPAGEDHAIIPQEFVCRFER